VGARGWGGHKYELVLEERKLLCRDVGGGMLENVIEGGSNAKEGVKAALASSQSKLAEGF
jgi:hypothetical protein